MSDEVFVGRCRTVVAALLRVAALVATLWMMGRVLESSASLISRQSFGGASRLDYVAIMLRLVGLAMCATAWFAAAWLARRLIPMPRERRNQCPKCKYPLEGLTGDTCPECGSEVR